MGPVDLDVVKVRLKEVTNTIKEFPLGTEEVTALMCLKAIDQLEDEVSDLQPELVSSW